MESDLGKLFIGGISWDTDEGKLRDYFSKYGDVVEAVIIRDRITGRPRGFGFIVFVDPCVAERVVMEKHIIDGRMIEAKKAMPRDDQQVLKRHASPIHLISSDHGGGGDGMTKKIFVGGLPSNITESEFKNYFDQFGTIADVVIMYDHNTQRPRGFGFITFSSDDSVDRVLHKTFHELNGKLIEVKRAVPKDISPVFSNQSPLPGGVYGDGLNKMSDNSYFSDFSPCPGFYNNLGSVGGRFSPVIGSGRNPVSGLDLNLNPSYDFIPSIPYFDGASPNRDTSPIRHNITESPYNPNNKDLWGNRTEASGPGWNSDIWIGNNTKNWGLHSFAAANDNNCYGRSFGTGSGLPASPFEGSIGEPYRDILVYSDQQQKLPPQSSHQVETLSRSYGYDIESNPTANDSEGYNVGNRQTNRGNKT